jgi:hypothetical protein
MAVFYTKGAADCNAATLVYSDELAPPEAAVA